VRVEEYRLPKGQTERQALVTTVGQDGFQLLRAVHAADAPPDLRARPALLALCTIWLQQYYGPHDLRWRTADDLPPHAQRLTSPYELEARFATKRDMSWTGYKVQLTETCDDDTPHLITNVETTPATTNDVEMIETIHRHLAAHDVLPAEHLVDSGYVAADVLVACQQEPAIDLVGPALPDSSWQAQTPEGLDVRCFVIDWEAGQVSCPAGHTSVRWTPGHDKQGDGQAIIAVQFDPKHCSPCPLRSRCTRAQTGPRTMKLRPRAQHEALQAARRRQQTDAFKEVYRQRAGVEGTLSQGVRAFGLRLARYRGMAKTRLQHILIAVAINVVRVVAWLSEQGRATTRVSAFAALVEGTS
jgi:transposase